MWLCLSFAAWYSAFSERSPWARASAISFTILGRSTFLSRFSSAFSRTRPPGVMGTRWDISLTFLEKSRRPARDLGAAASSSFSIDRGAALSTGDGVVLLDRADARRPFASRLHGGDRGARRGQGGAVRQPLHQGLAADRVAVRDLALARGGVHDEVDV